MWHEYVGNIHLHTTYSDGSISLPDLVTAAQQAGLDFLMPTDHDLYVSGQDGWYGRTLLLVGEELQAGSHREPGNHYLALGAEQEVAETARDTQKLIDRVRALGGLGFIAHPYEHAAPRFNQEAIPWLDWDVSGYTGISIWNYMSEFKTYLTSVPAALWATHVPQAVIRGPFPETMLKWDELLRQRRTPIIGTSDAHGIPYKWGPLRGLILPYPYLLRAVNTHILTPAALSGALGEDKRLVYAALASGNSFVGYDLLGDTRGFRFVARSGPSEAIMGQEIAWVDGMQLEVSAPQAAELLLKRDGQLVARARGRRLSYQVSERGVYRVEAWKRSMGKKRGWVFTNPIYVI